MKNDMRSMFDKLTVLENEAEHADALERTGFWGAQGAGCIVIASDTGRILLAHRSEDVEQPGTFGGWGGAIDADENPMEATIRELQEEAGYHGPIQMIPAYVFRSDTFRYYNFIAVVPSEFTPRLNWESQGYEWCEWGDLPQPLHFGLKALFNDPASVATIEQYAK